MNGILLRVGLMRSCPARDLQRRLYAYRSGSGGSSAGAGERAGLLRRLWASWIPLPAGVGLTLLAVLQWRRIQRRNAKQDLEIARDWEVECYRAVPLRVFSRCFGWLSETHLPRPVRPMLFSSYSRAFGVDRSEVPLPLDSYPTLSDFFCRSLRQGCRPIDPTDIVSPADGKVLSVGKITSCKLEQVKGVTYNIKAFLGPPPVVPASHSSFATPLPTWVPDMNRKAGDDDWCLYRDALVRSPTNHLYQCIVYLGPGDYHRFHAPTHIDVYHRRHFQGDLLSVSPRIAGWVPGLFELNERAVYFGSWQYGYFSFTAVGATNVGSIRVHDDKSLHTNERKWRDGTQERDMELSCSWNKGEEIGEFRMGSTIVLIFEGPPGLELSVSPGDRVKVGQSLVRTNTPTAA